MAWLQCDPSGNFHISFRFGGRKYKRSLRTKSESAAATRLSRLEETIRLVESGRIDVPGDADAPTFLLSDGKLDRKRHDPSPLTLTGLFERYFDAVPAGNLEESTLQGMRIHRGHLERHLGKRLAVSRLELGNLQKYVTARAKEKGIRGRRLSARTIQKEIVTLRTVWNWAIGAGEVKRPFPNRGLKLPKDKEKPPFQTWAEIDRQITSSTLSEAEQADLWDCLFLSSAEIEELLAYVQDSSEHAFIYPMFVLAAHTGARRSEILRVQRSDLADGFIRIRERKRVRGRESMRRVPMSEKLESAIGEWLAHHPGGPHVFCKGRLARSRNGSEDVTPITRDEAHDHFQRTLKGSKWEKIRGWHCLRHSFCSNCALKGIDQRIIDSWVGHTTDAMRHRYRHLFPTAEREAISRVFG